MADREQSAGSPQSRIFDPNKGEAPRRPASASDDDSALPVSSQGIERDPSNGRFLRPGFSAYLVAQARKIGLTDDDLRDMEDVAELKDTIRERRFEAQVANVFDPKRVADLMRTQSGTDLGTPTDEPPRLDLGIPPDTINPLVTQALEKVRDHYESKIASLEQQVAGLMGKEQQRDAAVAETFAKRIERAFAKYPNIFGAGRTKDLDPNSVELGFRLTANAFHRGSGESIEELEANIERFVQEKFGRRTKRTAQEQIEDDEDLDEGEEEVVDEAQQWEEGVLGRPTAPGTRESLPGREKAVQGVKKRLAGLQGTRSRPTRGSYLNHGRSQPQQGGRANGQGS